MLHTTQQWPRIRSLLLLLLAIAMANRQSLTGAEPIRKTENVIYVTLDGLRWQEVFGGAQEAFVSKACGVREVDDIAHRYLRPAAAERREALMPFLWKT